MLTSALAQEPVVGVELSVAVPLGVPVDPAGGVNEGTVGTIGGVPVRLLITGELASPAVTLAVSVICAAVTLAPLTGVALGAVGVTVIATPTVTVLLGVSGLLVIAGLGMLVAVIPLVAPIVTVPVTPVGETG